MGKFEFYKEFGRASASFDGQCLTADTGEATRRWQLMEAGLRTIGFVHKPTGKEWIIPDDAGPLPDWRIPLLAEPDSVTELVETSAVVIQNDPGTADHLVVALTFRYPRCDFLLRYEVRVYPEAPGLWTRLSVRSETEPERDRVPGYLLGAYGERLCLSAACCDRTAAGYYNDTQHRNHDDLPLLKTETTSGVIPRREVYDWASVLFLENDRDGLALVKESHKCVNQQGIDTGAFMVKEDSVTVTGLGLTAANYAGGFWLRADRWRHCWATWSLLYHDAGFVARQLAVKRFDRARYPFRPKRDMVIAANTWGSGGAGEGSRAAATEDNLLREIASCADLGIELLQIDDGWQCPPGADHPFEVDWMGPSPEKFPSGWSGVRTAASRTGVKLSLWAPWTVNAAALARNQHEAGFRRFKLDFINLNSKDDLDKLMGKVDELLARTDPGIGINWDATEVNARLGYYFGREHGNIYLENRENGPQGRPFKSHSHIRYTPRLVLRDAWHLAHYMNLNQIQITIQNIDRVVPDLSNCREYSHDYCFAIAMMAVPLFFQETHYLDEAARRQLRPVVATYKLHREAINAGFVFPIGDEPDDHSWTGFQAHDFDAGTGYLLLFRESRNQAEKQSIRLHAVNGQPMRFSDTDNDGTEWTACPDANGAFEFTIAEPASFRLLKYFSGQ